LINLVPFGLQKLLTRPLRLLDVRAYREIAGLGAGQSALNHYLRRGDGLGLRPNSFFEPEYYDAQLGSKPTFNRLLHYALIGRHTGLRPSANFDPVYYLQTYPDVQKAGHEPLAHFLRRGRYEGRQPCAEAALLRRRGVSVEDRIASFGQVPSQGGVKLLSSRSPAQGKPAPISPTDSAWNGLRPRREPVGAEQEGVIVAVPVYGGHSHTMRCLLSVLRAGNRTPFQLLVIDDASPDGQFRSCLDQLAARGLFRLLRHSKNLGFTATANEAMAYCSTTDLVLLNSDTEVFGNWIDRLVAASQRNRNAASLTPLSNCATIASYPHWLQNTPLPSEGVGKAVDPEQLDQLAAMTNTGRSVVIPTGVGFCIYLRRQAINAVGTFDAKTFGRGYGEEVDWCRRAVALGWEHRLISDVFVVHAGGVSFSASSAGRLSRAQHRIERRHPGYREMVQRFIAADPVFPERARLDLAQLIPHRKGFNVLQIAHSRGGGVERCLASERSKDEARGWGVFELRPSHRPGRLSLEHPAVDGTPSLWEINLALHLSALAELLESLGIRKLQLHHWIDFPPRALDSLLTLRHQLGLELEFWLHDFYPICPRVTLFDPTRGASGAYCGMPLAAQLPTCDQCLSADGLDRRTGSIQTWRARALQVLRSCDRVVAPSHDTALRYRAFTPEICIEVRQHDDPRSLLDIAISQDFHRRQTDPARPCRVLVLGAISASKGFHLLIKLAEANRQRQPPPLDLVLLGSASDEEALGRAGWMLLGRYRDSEVLAHLKVADPDVVFIPSLWPETHCYTLSHALASGRKVAAFDLGAQAERLRDWKGSVPVRVLPRDLAEPSEIHALIDSLQRLGADNGDHLHMLARG
jgi:O-antigen biosynthesis protein